MRACSTGSFFIAFAWLRPCQCLSKSRRLHSDLLVVLVVSCQSSLASGILRVCQSGGSSAFSLYSSLVRRYAFSLLVCIESISDLDVYCLPVLPRYQWLHGDRVGVSLAMSIGGMFDMDKIVAELLLYWYVGVCKPLDAALSAKWFPHISLVHSASSD